jgi:hypothetical protein
LIKFWSLLNKPTSYTKAYYCNIIQLKHFASAMVQRRASPLITTTMTVGIVVVFWKILSLVFLPFYINCGLFPGNDPKTCLPISHNDYGGGYCGSVSVDPFHCVSSLLYFLHYREDFFCMFPLLIIEQ